MKWWKLLLRVVAGLVMLIVIAALALFVLSSREINKTYAITPTPIAISRDSASIARGKHLVYAVGKCVDCHGDNLAGKAFIEDPVLGTIYGANLTTGKGGRLTHYSDADLVRVLRFGVKVDRKSLLFMPTRDFALFSDKDLASIIAYLRTLQAVDNEVPASTFGPLGRVLLVTKQVPEILPTRFISHDPASRPSIPEGVTVEYGAYLANTGGCTACHGANLAGGRVPGSPPDWPPATNLTRGGIGATWSEADFFRALREGIRPDKSIISAIMPWKYAGLMTDDEIRAVWLYLNSVPAVTSKAASK